MREVQDSDVEMEKVTKKTPKPFPFSHDWTYAMGHIKNQGQCGSCWAFGAVGTVEAQWTIAGNSPVVLAEQMLIDCGMGDCNGGWADRAYDTIISEGGDCLESDYPYQASNGAYCKSTTKAVSISGYNFVDVQYEGVDSLASSVYNNGPHSVYVYANSNFQTTIMVSLTIPHAAHLLTTMLLSMLDTTKVKASTESVTPGALPGENLATWELHGARILATLNVTLGCHICKSMPSFIK